MSINNYMSAEELGIQNHICLLPCGDFSKSGILNWTAEDLKPYQYYIVNEEAVDTLFKGLIFHPMIGRRNHFIYPMYTNFGLLPQKKDWKFVLEELFLDNFNLNAAAHNTEIGKKIDIWVTLLYPFTTQSYFGEVDGKELNFKEEEDRLIGMKWWIDKFLKEWNKASHLHKKLTFRGFVWPRASIISGDEELAKSVTAYIRKKGLLSLWLQQYGSNGCVDWKGLGFDASCTHPNYYGEMGPDFTWIANSTIFAKCYHLGMQITFGKGVLYKDNHLLDYLNYGVYNDYMNDSLLVFQFPNQTMREVYQNHPDQYAYLYTFIKKAYTPIYPTAAFPM